jgi:hypothetical protein
LVVAFFRPCLVAVQPTIRHQLLTLKKTRPNNIIPFIPGRVAVTRAPDTGCFVIEQVTLPSYVVVGKLGHGEAQEQRNNAGMMQRMRILIAQRPSSATPEGRWK